MRKFTNCLLVCVSALMLHAQQLPQQDITHPKADSWPTFDGDYSGKRYSPLKQINSDNVKGLTLAWISRVNMASPATFTGGDGTVPQGATANNRGTPLLVNGVIYMTEPNAMFAIDARTGRQIWHYAWKGIPAESLGNRGAGIYGDWVYFETPDCHLISLDMKTGKERWNQVIADVKEDHWCSESPLIIKNHVIVGVGGDFLDMANYAEARDPETGALQWHFWSTAHKGDPGFSSWPNEQAAEHGGGGVWTPPSYDPELNLVYIGTGNTEPTFVGQSRDGDNLYACSVVALNADTGKMAWYFQFSAHDTHDWDGSQIPVLYDGVIDGKPRKLLLQAYRGGIFFVLDRETGKAISETPFVQNLNWFKGFNKDGQPIRDVEKEPSTAGTLTSPPSGGATGYPSPAFNPDTGLFYVGTSESFTIFYKVDNDPQPEGYGAVERGGGTVTSNLKAIDYKTGKIVWSRATGNGAQNLMTTAGNLLFGSDGYGDFIAWDAKTGNPLWHSALLSNPGNAPITYTLDGKQYVLIAAGEDFYAFSLQGPGLKVVGSVLGIDVGTGGSRAVLVAEDGSVLASATCEHIPFASPHTAWAEQDPADWWRASQEAVREVLKSSGVDPKQIGGVGLTGQMHGAVLLDENGAVLRPSIIWCDQRTDEQCHWITEKVGAGRLLKLTCNPALTNFTLTKLLWVRQHEPEIWKKVRHVLLPKDYVRFRLSGEYAIDVADASGTLMLDVTNRRWSDELLGLVDVDRALLPAVFESPEICARVSAEAAGVTGIPAGTTIVAGAGDQAAGAIGMGITRPGAVSVTIGTSGVVFAATEMPSLDPGGRLHTFCHAIPGRWHVMGVTQAAGLSLRWIRDQFAQGFDYSQLSKEAAAVEPGCDGVLWAPYLMGERTPHLDSSVRASLTGLAASHTRGHVARAVMEGVAFSQRDSFTIFGELGVPVHRIRLSGGGARSVLWKQIQADVYGHPVETIAADEGGAYGAALLAGVGTGVWPSVDEACDRNVRTAETISPVADAVAIMNKQYERYRRIYPALKAIYQS